MSLELREYQTKAVDMARNSISTGHKRPLLVLSTGSGKCHGAGTEIIMHNMTTKKVEDIIVGDMVMGPDSIAKEVLSLATGEEELYKVVPVKGETYTVNKSHILSLRMTGNTHRTGKLSAGEKTNISVRDYLKSTKTFKHCAKGWRSGTLQLAESNPPIPPYIFGVWLGDGNHITNFNAITNNDKPIIKEWIAYGRSLMLTPTIRRQQGCFHVSISKTKGKKNNFLEKIRGLGFKDGTRNMFVPDVYMNSSKEQRLELIAGMLDTDGHLRKNGYDFISKDKKLSIALCTLCRSVGLAAYMKSSMKKSQTMTEKREYWRVSVNGDCDKIPCRVKKAGKRMQKKNVLNVGIKVEPIGIGKYYGFNVGGDGLYLLGDFTVTHNSIILGQIISLASKNGSTSLFLVHRRNLVTQFRDTLKKHFNIDAGVIMAGEDFEKGKSVYCATVQTYARRLNLDDRDHNKFFVDADILFVDEAHRSLSPMYQKVFNCYRDKIIIGTTATPMRSDQRGLGEVYDDLLDVVQTAELTAGGFLAPVRYFVPSNPDLLKIPMKMGDYSTKELGERVDKPKIVGNIVENWIEHAEGRKTIVFAVNVKHSRHIMESFLKVGIPAAHLDARSTDEERKDVFEKMESGEIKVVCNCALYIEGLDVPDISCVVMARPTKSLGLMRQTAGRGMRISDGFDDLVLIDHGGVVKEHGLLTDDVEWALDGKEKAWHKVKRKKKEKQLVKCQSCNLVFEGADRCPDCGSLLFSSGKDVTTADDDLQEITGKKKAKATTAEKRIYLGMCMSYAASKGWNPGSAAHKYKSKFHVFPRGLGEVSPIEPDSAFLTFQKHLSIKYARSKEKK